ELSPLSAPVFRRAEAAHRGCARHRGNSRLLIADEPTSALDTIVQKEITALLQRLVREDGMTLVFITHDIALASGLADRIAVFRHGRLIETGSAAFIVAKPQTDYTKALIAAVPDLEAVHG
ncbi:LOW QUALITY PROTEIN: ABC transporter, partial [Brucella melitensis bv. 2 str. 63/9]